jgi:hypothetical protein
MGAPATTSPYQLPPAAAVWPIPTEDHPRRWLVYPLLLAICALFAFALGCFYAGGHPGTDQAGYLMNTRRILEGHMGFFRDDPFQFVGKMDVLTSSGWIYGKYGFGYPLLAAIARWFIGIDGMYVVGPACTVLACIPAFFLFRSIVGSFAAIIGVLWLACNPITLYFAQDANSHAPTLLCVSLGGWGLFTWWQGGPWWRGFIGGMAFGYACAIRYTEFLLILPVLFVILARADFRPRNLLRQWPAILGWTLPIAALAATHWACYGAPWLTGYSLCKEQTGFGLTYFFGDDQATPPRQGNWQTLLYALNHSGLFLIWPICLGGMTALFWHSWRLATALALWVVPPTVLYMFYYWAPAGEESVSYLRFFLTVFPAMIFAGIWLLDRAVNMSRAARALCLGALTALGCSVNLANITPALENQYDRDLGSHVMLEEVQAHLPPGSVIFAEDDICNQLDSAGGWTLFDLGLFRPGAFAAFKKAVNVEDFDDPTPIQRTRSLEYMKLLGVEGSDGNWRAKPQGQIEQAQMDIVLKSLAAGKHVAFVFRGGPTFDMLAGRPDLRLLKRDYWRIPLSPTNATGLLTRWRKGVVNRPQPAAMITPAQAKARAWVLYEIVQDTQ